MRDRTRKVAFTGAAALLVGVLLLVNAHGRGRADRQAAHAQSSAVVDRTPTLTARSRSVQAAKPASPARTSHRERESTLAPTVAPREGQAAASAARVFLHGYLPYSYGRVDASRIRGAAPALVRVLREVPPRVPAAVARARPRLLAVLPDAATGERDVLIVAAVSDGRRRYDVRLTVHHDAGRWVVTEISG